MATSKREASTKTNIVSAFTLAATALLASSCSFLPSFNFFSPLPVGPKTVTPTVNQYIENVQCEIVRMMPDSMDQTSDPEELREKTLLNSFFNKHYVMYINLTIDKTNSQTLTPSFNILSPIAPLVANMIPMITFTTVVGGQAAGIQHRNVNITATYDIDPEFISDEQKKTCADYGKFYGLGGNLGLKEIVLAGMDSAYPTHPFFPSVTDSSSRYVCKEKNKGDCNDITKVVPPGFSTAAPAFANTTDFTVQAGLNGGPNWTLQTFKGPIAGGGGGAGGGMMSGGSSSSSMGAGGGSGGLVSINEIEKGTLVASFAQILLPPSSASVSTLNPYFSLQQPLGNQPPKKEEVQATADAQAVAAAVAAARNNAALLIYQNLGLPLVP
jgi:hypothetical protein